VETHAGELLRLLEATVHACFDAVEASVPDLRLDQAQVHVLTLVGSAGPLTIGEIHRRFGHRPSTVTAVVDRLERRGLVVRSINPADRRSFVVSLTDEGKRAFRPLQEAVVALESRVAGAIGDDGLAELGRLVEAARSAAGD
jgi:MarR family transcriptional regulator, organic hydroperoxide resistance regulator